MTRKIVVLGFDDCQSLDVTGPWEVFAAVAGAQAQQDRSPAYALQLVSVTGAQFASASGLRFSTNCTLAEATSRPYDTLLVAGGRGARRASHDERISKAVIRAAKRARRITSVCTGAFVLAAAGFLNGRRATTHFAHCAELRERFPEITVDPDPIFVRDGPVWTSAGVTAGIDLALALVEEDLGAKVALQVARQLVVFVRRAGGQSQFSTQLAAQAAQSSPIREIQSYIDEHPQGRLDLENLARRTHMSVRNFSRVFSRELGISPARYVERVRVETVRRLLETTDRSLTEIAEYAGFANGDALRRTLLRYVGLGPREYRERFCAIAKPLRN